MEKRGFKIFGVAFTLIWLFFCIFPLWWVFVTAFKPPLAVSQGPTYLPFIDFKPSLHAFKDAIMGVRGDFVRPLMNSVLVSASATFISVVLGSMAAYSLVRYQFKIRLFSGLLFGVFLIGGFVILTKLFGMGVPYAMMLLLIVNIPLVLWLNTKKLPGPVLANNDVTFWFVSQRMFPPIVSAFALFLLYAELNKVGIKMLDSYWGLVLAYTAFGLPFSVWLMRDFFENVPVEVEEAAMVDGVGPFRIFFQIVVPMSTPGLIATSMIILSFVWNEFLFALLLTSSKWQTLPVLLAGQNSSRGDEWWAISVAALISIIPMLIVAIFLGRMMRSGLLTGSIK